MRQRIDTAQIDELPLWDDQANLTQGQNNEDEVRVQATTRFTLNGGFAFNSLVTGNQTVTVQTITEFQYDLHNSRAAAGHILLGDTGGYFPTGSLRLNSGTSMLGLDAENGDDDTVNITLTVDGDTEMFTQPWSLWGEYLKFEIPMESALRAMCN